MGKICWTEWRRHFVKSVLLVLLTGGAGILFWFSFGPRATDQKDESARVDFPGEASQSSDGVAGSRAGGGMASRGVAAPAGATPSDKFFDALAAAIRQTDSREHARELLSEAWGKISDISTDQATRMILDFLDSGVDVETGLRFRVGQRGVLRSHPTLRVAALDWIGELNPRAAKEYARHIFETSDSADEWALGLRNYGRLIEPGADRYFAEIIERFVKNDDWRLSPSAGFFEGFDAVVYNVQTSLIEDLLELHAGDYEQLSIMVVTELAQQGPAEVIRDAVENDAWANAEQLRATVVSRANPLLPDQADLVVQYLLKDDVPMWEKEMFAEMFPLSSGFIGHRLLTSPGVRPLGESAEIDVATLSLVETWAADTRFARYSAILQRVQKRVNWYVASAREGGWVN